MSNEHTLTTKRRRDGRVRKGHPWVFSNELEAWAKPGPEPGDPCVVKDAKGRFLGRGYVNPKSLITVRLLSRVKREKIDREEISRRVRDAVGARDRLLGEDTDACRLINGEGDGLPGLVVDRYADVLCVQLLTQGIERWRGVILDTLNEVLSPRVIVDRADARGRALEGLPTKKAVIHGELAEGETVEIRQDGHRFAVDPLDGQKTGFFLDQRGLRRALGPYVAGRAVLDAFCYTGAASVYAAGAGAQRVVGVDSSMPALKACEANHALNQLADPELHQGDAVTVLQDLGTREETFGCVLLDPPPFAPSKKNVDEALRAHTRLHKLALRVLEPGGFLITSSCSHHVGAAQLGETLAHAALQSGKRVRQVQRLGAFADHPSHPGMPESEYLQTLVVQVC